jgi:hypothetical protein
MASRNEARVKSASGRGRALRFAAAAAALALGFCLAGGSLRASRGSGEAERAAAGGGQRGPQSTPHIGYGVNPVNYGDPGIGNMGFDWTKVWTGPDLRLPYRVLRREGVQPSTFDIWAGWDGGRGWLGWISDEARNRADWIEAWEIGNEVNLGAEFGWGAPPDAAAYTGLLCLAYERIKAGDPTAIVVSAGLAPVGRIPFTYNGHQGYCAPGVGWCGSGYYQDEREYLREMLDAGAANCFDALGYHPYGFAAPYDAAPGSWQCGANDFCFRGVEVIRDIMVNEYGVDKPIWATEFGWIVDPESVDTPYCPDGDPSWDGFVWMFVSPQFQASNLVGAYQYAEANYPWMGPMFVFNYGFSEVRGCNQMSFFDIKGRPAETELITMTEEIVPARPVWSGGLLMVEQGETRIRSGMLRVRNLSPEPIYWTASLISSGFPITLAETGGSYRDVLPFTADPSGLGLGTHAATVAVTVTTSIPVPVANAVQSAEVAIVVVEEIFSAYLPLVARSYP